jgi:hypothetical protein
LLLFLAVIAIVGFAAFKLTRPEKPTLDRASLCPITGPHGITVVLVDNTDDLPDTTKLEVRQVLNDLIQSLPAYHKLDIRVLDPTDRARSRSLFWRCNPGDGTGLSEWTDNPAIARKRWLEGFRKPAEEAMKNSLRFDRSKSTPLMEAIQKIAIDQFSPASAASIPKSLIIISDMLEHTAEYSQYSGAGDLSYQRYKRSPAYIRYRTDLHDAAVTMRYVQRLGPKVHAGNHIKFWIEWFEDNKGKVVNAKILQGAE